MKTVPSVFARNAIARLLLPRSADVQIGEIRLRSHQVAGVRRIQQSLVEFRGALLCDEVGLGKTFTAAAVMRGFSSACVIAPSTLLPMWRSSLKRAAVDATFISLEKFSRGPVSANGCELTVIDEAHNLRNQHTRRFENVAQFIRQSLVVLLSATPVHNSRTDIVSMLSLFLGSRAWSLGEAETSRCVIRRQRSRAEGAGFPRLEYIPAVAPPASASIRHKLVTLPAPIPPQDGNDCAALVQFTLLRQWASSDAALRAGLEARIGRAGALISALESGSYPTRKELSAWLVGGTDVQLALPQLLASPGGDKRLLDAVVRHEAATRDLLRALDPVGPGDRWRVEYLRDLRQRYPTEKIVAFTQFASTARSLFRFMSSDSKVALITAGRCEIASGRVSQRDIIERFAPIGSGVAPPPPREEITFLFATDLCSEGLNLQDAGVLVHLDIPWTPARLEQRVGRIARQGSSHAAVRIHTLSTPEIAEDLLRMGVRLQRKSSLADAEVAVADSNEAILALLEEWRDQPEEDCAGVIPLVGCTSCVSDCFVAVIANNNRQTLICGDREMITDDPREILRRIQSLANADVELSPTVTANILERIRHWFEQESLEESLGVARVVLSSRRRVARQIESVTARLPAHARANGGMLADRARRAVALQFNAGSEAILLNLANDPVRGTDWLGGLSIMDGTAHMKKAEPCSGSGFGIPVLLIGRKV